MKNKVKVSVVIPTYDRLNLLKKCLNSVLLQSLKPFEIIIVDNKGQKNLSRYVSVAQKTTSVRLRYVYESQKGASKARNAGINVARSLYIAFLDDDCIAYADWLEHLIAPLYSTKIKATFGQNLNSPSNTLFARNENETTSSFFDHSLTKIGNHYFARILDTKNCAINRNFITRHKILFDPIFDPYTLFEDVDFGLQITEHGGLIEYIKGAKITHSTDVNILRHVHREFRIGQAYRVLLKKWSRVSFASSPTKLSLFAILNQIIRSLGYLTTRLLYENP